MEMPLRSPISATTSRRSLGFPRSVAAVHVSFTSPNSEVKVEVASSGCSKVSVAIRRSFIGVTETKSEGLCNKQCFRNHHLRLCCDPLELSMAEGVGFEPTG